MQRNNEAGFSLIELIVALAILLILMGGMFQVIRMVQERSSNEQSKVDMFQEGREFMDQMSRDLHQAGYPSPRNFLSTVLTSPTASDMRAAAGLVKVDAGDLWFEGDVDGQGSVSVIHYWRDPSTTNGCPCLKRSQLAKQNGNPVTGQLTPVYQTEVQGVLNTDIFSAFEHNSGGTAVSLPADFNSNANTIANIDTIKAVVTLQSPNKDFKTGQRPVTTLVTTVKLSNCSQAAIGFAMSCR